MGVLTHRERRDEQKMGLGLMQLTRKRRALEYFLGYDDLETRSLLPSEVGSRVQ